ncbi:MAG: glycosyltransferase family 1 protein, partial [Tepidisphaeraceae bacterium]
FAWSENVERWCEQVRAHDRHLTYAENIHSPDCIIPKVGIDWRPTRCIVTLADWKAARESAPPKGAAFTTVMSWSYFKGPLTYRGVEYGAKAPEYDKFHDLPRRTSVPLTLAVAGHHKDDGVIRGDGWNLVDGWPLTLTAQDYERFISDSAGEWSIAKNVYVATNSGWFSCRTACYLAAGRPAVVQDTKWSRYIPSGDGLVAFDTIEQAVDGLNRVAAEPRKHRAGAYEVAREHLSHDRVLPRMLDDIFR